MTIRRHRTRVTAVALGFALAATVGVSACSKTERWCELDRGDVLVENYHCENNEPGYEWEPDHDKPKSKKKPIKTSKKH
ncbi:hypothetical protein IU449_21435 [Nocardia higoensis]|uniref:Lipoprotein n=1 Tax=Nocardia higoensis TaxID=228599 RepID=A0ABS0DF33_9NOCA|nr:hypothetical protein [Nocardia higoensis]MBF6357075.1 hypothetical protein [Nocardia higoensis]